jgi:hypothetical protein
VALAAWSDAERVSDRAAMAWRDDAGSGSGVK